MKKTKTYPKVMASLEISGKGYRVLNEQNGIIQHIRMDDGTDIWPATGTCKINGKYYRRDLEMVRKYLRNDLDFTPKKTQYERIKDLEEYVLHLQCEIDMLRRHLSI